MKTLLHLPATLCLGLWLKSRPRAWLQFAARGPWRRRFAPSILTLAALLAAVWLGPSPAFGAAGLELLAPTSYTLIWNDIGSGADANFSAYAPVVPPGFHALGHYATNNYNAPLPALLLARECEPGALAPPTGYVKIWDESGSGAALSGSFWRPIPPPGYVSLGDVGEIGHNTPPPLDAVRCVRNDLVVMGTLGSLIWTDSGSGADDDFSAWRINCPANGVDSGAFVARSSHAPPPGPYWCLLIQPPAITCPADIVASADAGQCSKSNVTYSATATDNCTNLSVVCTPPSGSTFPVGQTTVACTATNGMGDSNACSFNVTINTGSGGSFLELLASTTYTLIWNDSGSGADSYFSAYAPVVPPGFHALGHYAQRDYNPPAGSMLLARERQPGALAPPTGYVKIWDDSGSGADLSGSFWRPIPPPGYVSLGDVGEIGHNTPPPLDAVWCVRNDLVVPASLGTLIWNDAGSGADDDFSAWRINCPANGVDSGAFVARASHAPPPGPYWCLLIQPIQPPAITCPADIVASADPGQCSKANVTYSATATNSCGINLSVVCSPPSGSTFPVGQTTVTCTATNSTGGSNSCSFTVTIETDAISIICPPDLVVGADPGQCSKSNVTYSATATDSCGTNLSAVCSPPSGSTFPVGQTTVTCTTTNGIGVTTNCSFNVTINATVHISCPPDLVVGADPGFQCSKTNVTYSAPANCGDVSVTCSPPSDSTFPLGTNTVICTATNSSGDTTNCSFTVTVRDVIPPRIFNCPAAFPLDTDPGLCTAELPDLRSFVVAEDECTQFGDLIRTQTPPPGTLLPSGLHPVTVTIFDEAGNFVDCTIPVTVTYTGTDTNPPTINCPADIVVAIFDADCSTNVAFTVTASDNCGTANVTCSPASGSLFAVGTTTVICIAEDGRGNTNFCSFPVMVNDTAPPTITCPSNIVVFSCDDICGSNVTFTVTASDNCGTANVTCSPASGSLFNRGTTNVTCLAEDGHGNTNSCSFPVTVNLPPLLVRFSRPDSGFMIMRWGPLPCGGTSWVEMATSPAANAVWTYESDLNPVVVETTNSMRFYRVIYIPPP